MAGWITVKGTHVYVEDGESVEEAFARTTGSTLEKANNKTVNSNIKSAVNNKAEKKTLDKKAFEKLKGEGKINPNFDVEKYGRYFNESGVLIDQKGWTEARIRENMRREGNLRRLARQDAETLYPSKEAVRDNFENEILDMDSRLMSIKDSLFKEARRGYSNLKAVAEISGGLWEKLSDENMATLCRIAMAIDYVD